MVEIASSAAKAWKDEARPESGAACEIAGDEASASGDESGALDCWGEALGFYASRAMAAEAARVATKLAMAEENLGETEEACAHYGLAAEFYRASGNGERAPMCLNNQAMLVKLSGDTEGAAELLSRALEEASHHHGGMDGETALIAANLGTLLCACGDLEGAEQRHMQALRIREQLYGATHPDIGLSLGHLAVIHQIRGDIRRAKSFYASALAILDEFPELHGAERAVLRENMEAL